MIKIKAKQIPEFPCYAVTKDGRVLSMYANKCKWLIPITHCNNYLYVNLCKNRKKYKKLIHHLVLETYIGYRPKGMECRHLDGNPQNNELLNLAWGTRKENASDAVKHGTHTGLKNKGEKHPLAKLTEQNVRMIVKMYRIDDFTQKEIANLFGICSPHVSDIVNKKTWKHLWE